MTSIKTDIASPASNPREHPIVRLIKDALERNSSESIADFAQRAGLARATVYHLLTASASLRLRVATLFKLEAALEIPVSDLIELFRPASEVVLERDQLEALSALRGKYARAVSLSAELRSERRAERE